MTACGVHRDAVGNSDSKNLNGIFLTFATPLGFRRSDADEDNRKAETIFHSCQGSHNFQTSTQRGKMKKGTILGICNQEQCDVISMTSIAGPGKVCRHKPLSQIVYAYYQCLNLKLPR